MWSKIYDNIPAPKDGFIAIRNTYDGLLHFAKWGYWPSDTILSAKRIITSASREIVGSAPCSVTVMARASTAGHTEVENGISTRTYIICIATAATFGIWYWTTSRHQRVTIESRDCPFDPNTLKTQFKRACALFEAPPKRDGEHRLLAFQRRAVEGFAIQTFVTAELRFRDVGGSRTRYPECHVYKHVCGPVIDSSDILREQKGSESPFSNCRTIGSKCPSKADFPCAILCHSDYHMDAEELVQVVVGPTFVINHRFEGHCGTFSDEATWVKIGNNVRMTTTDGTPYMHRWNAWGTEGCCVTSKGAFTYVRIGTYLDTDLYFCYPSPGTYSTKDALQLRRSANYRTTDNHMGLRADESGKDIILTLENSIEVTLPAHIVVSSFVGVASLPRDAKFYDHVHHFVGNKLMSAGLDRTYLDKIVSVVIDLATDHAENIVERAQTGYNPGGTWVARQYHHLKRRLTVTRRRIGNEGAFNWVMRWRCGPILAPWAFKSIQMPYYVAHVKPLNVQMGGESHPKATRRFRDSSPSHSTTSDDGSCGVSGSMPGEHHSELGAASAEPGASACPSDNDSVSESENDFDSCWSNLPASTPLPPEQYRDTPTSDGIQDVHGSGESDTSDNYSRADSSDMAEPEPPAIHRVVINRESKSGSVQESSVFVEVSPTTGFCEIILPLIDTSIQYRIAQKYRGKLTAEIAQALGDWSETVLRGEHRLDNARRVLERKTYALIRGPRAHGADVQSAKTRNGGVLDDAGDEVDLGGEGPITIPQVGKAVRQATQAGARGGLRRNKKGHGADTKGRAGKVLRKSGSNKQPNRSAKHQPKE